MPKLLLMLSISNTVFICRQGLKKVCMCMRVGSKGIIDVQLRIFFSRCTVIEVMMRELHV